MSELSPAGGLWLAKIAGAIAGSAISLAYLLPHSRREAGLRFVSGVAAGLIFGATTGIVVADRLGISDVLSPAETVLMGAGVASLGIWWAMGLVMRLADRRLFATFSRDASPGKKHENDTKR